MPYTHLDRERERERQGYTYINVPILIRTHVSLTCQSRDESWQREKQTGKHKYQINMFSQTASRPRGRVSDNTRKPTPTQTTAKCPTCPTLTPQTTKQKRRVKRNIFIDIAVVGLRFSVFGSRYSVSEQCRTHIEFQLAAPTTDWNQRHRRHHWLHYTHTILFSLTIPAWHTPPAPPRWVALASECGVYVPYIKGLWAKRLCVWQQQAFKGFFHTHTQPQPHQHTHTERVYIYTHTN